MYTLCLEPTRRIKTRRIMNSLATGGCGQIGTADPTKPFIIWGHRWLSEKIVPDALKHGTNWWLIDNGYHLPSNGTMFGYYSITNKGPAPQLIHDADLKRLPVKMKPWKRNGSYILLAMPSQYYGVMMGYNMIDWRKSIISRIREFSDRPILVREKDCSRDLSQDFENAFVVVTHSSKTAIKAIVEGIPSIVEPTCGAVPIAGTNLQDLENPPSPDGREEWWASLMAQQFTLNEMKSGKACELLGISKKKILVSRESDIKPKPISSFPAAHPGISVPKQFSKSRRVQRR